MKIVHVIVCLNVGGAEMMLQRLVTSYVDRSSHNHMVVSLSDLGLVGQQLREQGIEVIVLGMNSIFQVPVVFLRLLKVIRSRQPDIVQTWMYHADLIGGLASRLAGCRKVIWGIRYTDLFPNNGVSQSTVLIMRLCAMLSRVIPHTIVCVAHRARVVHVDMGYVQHKMTVIGNGFDLEKFKFDSNSKFRIRQSLNLPPDALVVGSNGRFNEYKDHHRLILAAGKLASFDDKINFLLAGRDVDPNNPTIMKWLEETGYTDRFRLLGERSDVVDILSAIDVFCLHSISEGFPNVLGEAMSIGLPSVVTNVGDAALLLGEAGLVVPPRDTEALMQGLLKLIQASTEHRAWLGNIARKRVEANYSISSIQHQYEELYQKVLSA